LAQRLRLLQMGQDVLESKGLKRAADLPTDAKAALDLGGHYDENHEETTVGVRVGRVVLVRRPNDNICGSK